MTYASILNLYMSNCRMIRADHEMIPFRVIEYDFGEHPSMKMETDKGSVEVIWKDGTGICIRLKSIGKALCYVHKDGTGSYDEWHNYKITVHHLEKVKDENVEYWVMDSEGAEFNMDERVEDPINFAAYGPFINAEMEVL